MSRGNDQDFRSDDMESWYANLYRQDDVDPAIVASIADDDCAAINISNACLVITTDYVNASPIGRTLGIATYRDLGAYLVSSNVADLLGSGAEPKYLLTSIMWPRDGSRNDFEELCHGIAITAQKIGARMVGGDTKLGRVASLCATAIGLTRSPSTLRLKSQAKPGHTIWLSGPIGSCAAGALGLSDERTKSTLSSKWCTWAAERIGRPKLPIDRAKAVFDLSGCGGTDLSDGLVTDLANMCEASGVSARLYLSQIPIEPETEQIAKHLGILPQRLALTIGGDLQFLLSAPPELSSTLVDAGFVKVGNIVDDRSPNPRVTLEMAGANKTIYGLPDSLGHKDYRKLSFIAEIELLLTKTERIEL